MIPILFMREYVTFTPIRIIPMSLTARIAPIVSMPPITSIARIPAMLCTPPTSAIAPILLEPSNSYIKEKFKRR